jgi:hypothetical protein
MGIIHKRSKIHLCLPFDVSRDEIDLNQLSFGISGGLIQSQLDETSFRNSGNFDPIIDGTDSSKDSYFNVDIGASYNYLDFMYMVP